MDPVEKMHIVCVDSLHFYCTNRISEVISSNRQSSAKCSREKQASHTGFTSVNVPIDSLTPRFSTPYYLQMLHFRWYFEEVDFTAHVG